MFRPRLFALLLVSTLLMLLQAAPGMAAKEAPAPDATPAEIVALASGDTQQQWLALATLRKDPAAARQALLQALQRPEPLPGRWRLIYRLEEFGTEEDVPLLLKLREEAQNPRERRVAEGAARALYDPIGDAAAIGTAVLDFSFIQTGRPTPLDDPDQGKWMLTRWSMGEYEREEIPLAVIKQLRPLRGKAFDSRRALSDALQKRLAAKDWKALRDRLLASVDTIPKRVQLKGLARVRMQNPLQRPLLLRLSLDVWFGSFRTPPEPAWVYLDPGTSQTVDIPVDLQGDAERTQMRLDLRLDEIDNGYIPDFHKLYLPLQP
ncbi:MAG TPA: hypothetical protein VKB51_00610 [bacterium]|nr:hypothetical protein [bacterium]